MCFLFPCHPPGCLPCLEWPLTTLRLTALIAHRHLHTISVHILEDILISRASMRVTCQLLLSKALAPISSARQRVELGWEWLCYQAKVKVGSYSLICHRGYRGGLCPNLEIVLPLEHPKGGLSCISQGLLNYVQDSFTCLLSQHLHPESARAACLHHRDCVCLSQRALQIGAVWHQAQRWHRCPTAFSSLYLRHLSFLMAATADLPEELRISSPGFYLQRALDIHPPLGLGASSVTCSHEGTHRLIVSFR